MPSRLAGAEPKPADRPGLPGELGSEVQAVHRRVQGDPAEVAMVVQLTMLSAERDHLLARRVAPQRLARRPGVGSMDRRDHLSQALPGADGVLKHAVGVVPAWP